MKPEFRGQIARLYRVLVLLCAGMVPSVASAACPAVTGIEPLRSPVFDEGRVIAAADVRADFEGWMTQLEALHPDLSLRTDRAAFNRIRASITADLNKPMTQRQAWLTFARLNPALGDGHNGISIPNASARTQAFLASGGRLLPVRVIIDADGGLRAAEVPEGASNLAVGDRLLSINGRTAREIVAAMLAVTEGDTPAFRRALAQRRFRTLFLRLYGDTGSYRLESESPSGCRTTQMVPGLDALPARAQADPPSELVYAQRILPGGIGYLRVDEFGGQYREAFAAFAKAAFADFKAMDVRAVIIDVRENGGGDDPLWQESLMEHLTTKPYVHVSRYAIRVTEDNADPGDVVGEVQHNEYRERFIPEPDNPIRFDGPAYVLAGPYTYSSAIQFLVAAQDFGVATIAGQETGGLSCQTGLVRGIAMPMTGLRAFTPIAAFTRPSGEGCDRGVIPDVQIDDDGLDPDRAPAILAALITGQVP